MPRERPTANPAANLLAGRDVCGADGCPLRQRGELEEGSAPGIARRLEGVPEVGFRVPEDFSLEEGA